MDGRTDTQSGNPNNRNPSKKSWKLGEKCEVKHLLISKISVSIANWFRLFATWTKESGSSLLFCLVTIIYNVANKVVKDQITWVIYEFSDTYQPIMCANRQWNGCRSSEPHNAPRKKISYIGLQLRWLIRSSLATVYYIQVGFYANFICWLIIHPLVICRIYLRCYKGIVSNTHLLQMVVRSKDHWNDTDREINMMLQMNTESAIVYVMN